MRSAAVSPVGLGLDATHRGWERVGKVPGRT
jgi:hypothetical protein